MPNPLVLLTEAIEKKLKSSLSFCYYSICNQYKYIQIINDDSNKKYVRLCSYLFWHVVVKDLFSLFVIFYKIEKYLLLCEPKKL